MNIPSRAVSLCALAAVLSACGGSGTNTPAQTTPPVSSGSIVTPPPAPVQQAPAAYASLLQQIHVAYYGRPADPAGLALWSQRFSNENMPLKLADIASSYTTNATVKQIIDTLASATEAKDITAGTSAAFVNAVYLNAFNRVAEPAASASWSAMVNGGTLTRAQAALVILGGAQGDDALMAAKKVQAAVATTAALDTPAESAAYGGSAVLQGARDLLSSITSTTDMAIFQAQIDGYVGSLPGTQGTSPTIARYVGFSTLQRFTGGPSYSAQYSYASGGIVAPGTAGTLTYGLDQLTVGWTRAAPNQIVYGANFTANASIQGGGVMPAVTMLCRPLTPGSPSLKSTDVLVARSARQIGAASELAGQTLSIYREDCAIDSGVQSISFDSVGNATFTSAAGVSKIDAVTVSAGLNGLMLRDVVSNLDFYFFAYRYVRAGGSTGYAVVQRMSVPATTGILPGESVAVWSQE